MYSPGVVCVQINKQRKRKFGKLPTKQVIRKPWEALCVDLIGTHTLKGKNGTEINFMFLTMIDPASSWFEMAEIPVIEINRLIGIIKLARCQRRLIRIRKKLLDWSINCGLVDILVVEKSSTIMPQPL